MIQLSASKLGILRDCPRCFWDANNSKFARPRGIFSSLPGGIDLLMKNYFNSYRGSLPSFLQDRVEGVLMSDAITLKKWQHWKTGLTWQDNALGVRLIGGLDDCLKDEKETNEIYTPLDNKTKGSKPKNDGSQYYQTQMDCYGLLLQSNGHKISGKAFLAYYYPSIVISQGILSTRDTIINFGVDIYQLESSPDGAVETLKKAVESLKGKRPEPAPDCEYCKFGLMYPRG